MQEFYIKEKRNSEVWWNENCSLKEIPEVEDHLLVNPYYKYLSKIAKAPPWTFKGKILEALYIRKFK